MQARRRRKRRYAAPVGGMFLLLAAVGVIAVVVVSLRLTSRVLDNTSEKEMFEDIIRPVLMFDPVPFEDASDIQMDRLLLYSMWATLLNNQEKYDFGAGAEVLVAKSDLDVAANSLFYTRDELVLEHDSFGDYLSTYYFDEVSNMYTVPLYAELYVYSPKVQEIERVSQNEYRLRVGYIPPGNAWTSVVGGGKVEPLPDKEMYYYVMREGNTYQISRVEDITAEPPVQSSVPELPVVEPESSEEPSEPVAANVGDEPREVDGQPETTQPLEGDESSGEGDREEPDGGEESGGNDEDLSGDESGERGDAEEGDGGTGASDDSSDSDSSDEESSETDEVE